MSIRIFNFAVTSGLLVFGGFTIVAIIGGLINNMTIDSAFLLKTVEQTAPMGVLISGGFTIASLLLRGREAREEAQP